MAFKKLNETLMYTDENFIVNCLEIDDVYIFSADPYWQLGCRPIVTEQKFRHSGKWAR